MNAALLLCLLPCCSHKRMKGSSVPGRRIENGIWIWLLHHHCSTSIFWAGWVTQQDQFLIQIWLGLNFSDLLSSRLWCQNVLHAGGEADVFSSERFRNEWLIHVLDCSTNVMSRQKSFLFFGYQEWLIKLWLFRSKSYPRLTSKLSPVLQLHNWPFVPNPSFLFDLSK